MKKSLLATVAAVALIAGAGMASAADGGKDQGKGPAAGHAEMQKAPDAKGGAEMRGKAETTGAGAAEEKAAPKAEMKSEAAPKAEMDKAAPKTEMKSENKADPKAAPAAKSAADEKKAPAAKSAADEKKDPAARTAGDEKANSTTAKPDAKAATDTKTDTKSNAAAADAKGGKTVSLTTEQKTKIRTTVIQSGNAPKVSRSSINFNISVGTAVPRSVHYVTVPTTIVEYYPAYRGFDYFVVDEQIIILDPHTLQIVAILDV